MKTHGVIDGLTESFEYTDFASRIDGGAKNDLLKQVDGEMLRTREGKKKASTLDMPKSVEIEKLVSAGGRGDVASLVRQGWWIQDNQVKARITFLEIAEGVGL